MPLHGMHRRSSEPYSKHRPPRQFRHRPHSRSMSKRGRRAINCDRRRRPAMCKRCRRAMSNRCRRPRRCNHCRRPRHFKRCRRRKGGDRASRCRERAAWRSVRRATSPRCPGTARSPFPTASLVGPLNIFAFSGDLPWVGFSRLRAQAANRHRCGPACAMPQRCIAGKHLTGPAGTLI